MSVVQLKDYRKQQLTKEPPELDTELWVTGTCKCLACSHEWVETNPLPPQSLALGIVCPKCDTSRGQLVYPVPPEKHEHVLECSTCSSVNFHIVLEDGPPEIACVGCGSRIRF